MNRFKTAFFVGVLLRLGLFIILILNPITLNSDTIVSPIVTQTVHLDMSFYIEEAQKLQSNNVIDLLKETYIKLIDSESKSSNVLMKGPLLYPLLINLLHYLDYPIFLSLLNLFLSIALLYFWLQWLNKKNISLFWLFLFSIFPYSIWLTFFLNPALIFSLLVAIYFYFYVENKPTDQKKDLLFQLLLCGGMLITSPHAISIIVFSLCLLFTNKISKNHLFLKVTIIFLTLIGVIYFLPYFIVYINKSMSYPLFFNTQQNYINGLFQLPTIINLPISWGLLFFSKIAHLAGFKYGSAGDINLWVIARWGMGILILPGIIYSLFVEKKWNLKLFFALIYLPAILGYAHPRYIYSILPILFYYSIVSYHTLLKKMSSLYNKQIDKKNDKKMFDFNSSL